MCSLVRVYTCVIPKLKLWPSRRILDNVVALYVGWMKPLILMMTGLYTSFRHQLLLQTAHVMVGLLGSRNFGKQKHGSCAISLSPNSSEYFQEVL